MRIITNLDADTYEQVEALVSEKGYKDVDQFIRAAVQNQISLERNPNQVSTLGTPETVEEYDWNHDIPNNPPVDTPFNMDRCEILLFQQYYRFLPLVVVMAELAQTTEEQGGPIELGEFRDHMEDAIKPIRNRILAWEDENNVKRQNRKSTGLPKTDVKNPEYSMKRFLDHYVGKIRQRDNHPISFGNSLGLISYNPIDDDTCLVQLSPSGREFVQIGNPLLTDGPEQPTLSAKEREFLISHIEQNLDEEFYFMREICRTLEKNDENSYTNKLPEFAQLLSSSPGFSDDDPSEERVRSHTAGTLSRMVELGILSRGSKRGVYVPEMMLGAKS